MNTLEWLTACAAEADKGFDPNVNSYHLGWAAAVEHCAKVVEADMQPAPKTEYQVQYNAGITIVARKLRKLK